MDNLIANFGFRISESVYNQVLRLAGGRSEQQQL